MLTVLMIKPDCDAVLIDLAHGATEAIQSLTGGPYTMTHIRASNMCVIHNSEDIAKNFHFNREIDRKLYFGTIIISGSDRKSCLVTLQNDDILKLVELIPQKHQNNNMGTPKSDSEERIKWLKEQNGFVQYGKKKTR